MPARPSGSELQTDTVDRRTPPGWWRAVAVVGVDKLLAAVVALGALLVYVRTLAPGLVAETDTPKFQFVGRVLGVPHNPGYPLYVLISALFSLLPFGNLAYRINLLSACLAALAVGLLFLVARRLGAGRIVSVASAWCAAFGVVLWNNSVVAEVYALEAALLMGLVLAIVTWRQTKHPVHFYMAVLLLALSLAHHTTIVMAVPALVLYIAVVDARWALRLRTISASTVLLALGLSLYGFIILRTYQHAAVLESRALNLRELIDVVRGRQFADHLWPYDLHTLLTGHLPTAWHLFAVELRLPAVLVAIFGLGVLMWRRRPEGLLLGLGLAGYVAFTCIYAAVDIEVFLIPAFLLAGILLAVGLEEIARLLEPWRAAAVAPALAVVLVAWQLAGNFTACDHSGDRNMMRYFDALFERLPGHSAIVTEDFLVDRMVQYKLLGERAAAGRVVDAALSQSPDEVADRFRRGYAVFAFGHGAARLRAAGFRFARVSLPGVPLGRYLRELPVDRIVLLAAPAGIMRPLAPAIGPMLPAIGGREPLKGRTRLHYAAVGVTGRGGAIEKFEAIPTMLTLQEGEPIGASGVRAPVAIGIEAGAREAAIRLNTAEVVRAVDSIAIVVMQRDGRIDDMEVVPVDEGLQVPVSQVGLPVFQLHALPDCVPAAHGWTDVTRMATGGKATLRLPPGSTGITLYASRQEPFSPFVAEQTERTRTRVTVEPFARGGASSLSLDVRLDSDTVDCRDAVLNAAFVSRVHVDVRTEPFQTAGIQLAFQGVPDRAIARVSGGDVPAAAVCRALIGDQALLEDRAQTGQAIMLGWRDAEFVGTGWSAQREAAGTPFRSMTAEQAVLLLPLGGTEPLVVRLTARGLAEPPPGSRTPPLSLTVNGHALPAGERRQATDGWTILEWRAEAGALKAGVNRLVVTRVPDATPSPASVDVREVRLIRDDR